MSLACSILIQISDASAETRGPLRAICHGMSHLIGQVAVGCLADLVIWKPENFGAKPEMIVKGGVIAWAQVRVTRLSS